MILDNTKNNKGFTLIELLVVIAIIALLATVVLASLGDARIRAENSAKNQEVDQLINALALYHSDNDGYPYKGDTSDPLNLEMYCVGYDATEKCFGPYPDIFGYFTGNNELNTSLNEYPANKTSVDMNSKNYRGIVYGCSDSGERCNDYELWWFLVNENSCPKGSEPTTYPPNVLCKFRSTGDYN